MKPLSTFRLRRFRFRTSPPSLWLSRLVFPFILGCSGPVLVAQDSDVPAYDVRLTDTGRERFINLNQAIAAALRASLEIQIEAISPQLEADRSLQAEGEFDPTFEIRSRYEKLDTPQTSQEFISTGGSRFQNGQLIGSNRVFAEENLESKTGITGKLRTGTEYDFGFRANRFSNDLTRDDFISRFDPEYRAFAGVSILQPLLRDFGKSVNEAQIRVSRRDKAIADQAFRQTLAGIIKETVAAYYDTYLAYEDAKVKQFDVEVLNRMASEKRDQLERGTATPRDFDEVKNSLAEGYERFLLSQQTLLSRNGDLLMLLQDDFDFDTYPIYLPIESPQGYHPPLDPNELVRQAMEHRPEYLMAVQTVEKLGIVLKYRENQLLPRVDLEGTFGYVGLSGNYGDAFSEAMDGQGHEYGVGFVVRMPFGNREKKGLYAETRHQQRQAILRVKHEEMQTQILVNRHLTAVRTHEKRLEAARMSIRLEEDSLEKSRESLEKGTISESAVMKVERDVRETRLRQYAAAADLQLALIDLWETNGTLLSRFGVVVEDATLAAPAEVLTEVEPVPVVAIEDVVEVSADSTPAEDVSADSRGDRPRKLGSGLLELLSWGGEKKEETGEDSPEDSPEDPVPAVDPEAPGKEGGVEASPAPTPTAAEESPGESVAGDDAGKPRGLRRLFGRKD